ncbi:uncharacterized protein N7477_007617 [Penicillium maclennaniae]|uniref:uncharacterized protein n=1 Tax=Penicillium maclennaniae TaxID=1343394 RepID=UPI00254024AC|nr:uncharacterized protein N7477_007617 [Penicillium maclennaniae]KAJ5665169.1 hypothetical protein N7477_007617 [Penicillium maclennaniae]
MNRPRRQGIIKKVMQQDVLYLLIVNLPTVEEVQDSVTRLESLVEQQQTGQLVLLTSHQIHV